MIKHRLYKILPSTKNEQKARGEKEKLQTLTKGQTFKKYLQSKSKSNADIYDFQLF
jgi:hypothetical protein